MKTRIVLLILCSLPFFSGCSVLGGMVVPKPTLDLQGVKFGQVNFSTATLLFDVEVDNPYTVELPLLALDYSLTSQKNPLFKGQSDIATTIPPKEKKAVSLPVTVGYADVITAFENLKDVRPGSMIPYDASLSISTKAPLLGKVKIPLHTSGDLQIPSFQDISTWKSIFEAIRKVESIQR